MIENQPSAPICNMQCLYPTAHPFLVFNRYRTLINVQYEDLLEGLLLIER